MTARCEQAAGRLVYSADPCSRGARNSASAAAKAVGDALFSRDPDAALSARLKEARERAGQGIDRAKENAERAGASAQDRISAVRRRERGQDRPAGPADESAPTGI